MESCSKNCSEPSFCLDCKNATVLHIQLATVPNCQSGDWQPLTSEWNGLVLAHVALFGSLFLLLAIVCLIFLYKHRTTVRLRGTKTFISIDVALVILGFSRVIFYALDPYDIFEYCDSCACVVVSRVLFAFSYPSLTASYTLSFATLWHVSAVKLGRNRVERWKIIVPLCFIHYFVAVAAELIFAFSTYSVIFLLLVCEFALAVFGLVVCSTFLVVGCKILKSVKDSAQNTAIAHRNQLTCLSATSAGNCTLSRMETYTVDSTTADEAGDRRVDSATPVSGTSSSESPVDQPAACQINPGSELCTTTCDEKASSPVSRKSTTIHTRGRFKSEKFMLKHHEQAIRKVSIITYAVAVLGALYSLLGLAQLIMLVMTLFGPCPEDKSPTKRDPYVWLALTYISSFLVILLASLMVYSANEIRPIFQLIRNITCTFFQCKNLSQTGNVTTTKHLSFRSGHTLDEIPHPPVLPKPARLTVRSVRTALSTDQCKQSAEAPGTADPNQSDNPLMMVQMIPVNFRMSEGGDTPLGKEFLPPSPRSRSLSFSYSHADEGEFT